MNDTSIGIVPILIRNGHHEFLVVHQGSDYWGFPKGHAHAGETDRDAALRELHEETGITDCILSDDSIHVQHYSFEHEGATIEKDARFFLGITTTREINVDGEEITEYIWLPYTEAREKLTYTEGKETLDAAEDYIQKHQSHLHNT